MITSTQLGVIPFVGNTDASRVQMAAKQISQSLTHPNCNIPYVISEKYHHLSNNSYLGIKKARDDGIVIFNGGDIIIYKYNCDKIPCVNHIPSIKSTHGNFASSLRFSLNENTHFKKNDVIWEYDCFFNGIPSYGYNVMSAYMTFFGFGFEDSLVISESFANKAQVQYIEKVFLPIYETTSLKPIYKNIEGSMIYFPGKGKPIIDNILCCYKNTNEVPNISKESIDEINAIVSKMNMSDLNNSYLNISNTGKSERVKLDGSILNGFKIHKLKETINMVDVDLKNFLEKMNQFYENNYILDNYSKLSNAFGDKCANYLTTRFFRFKDRETNRKDLQLHKLAYLIEFEIVKKDRSYIGDKFSNRYGGKGVVSLILPDDLRPVTLKDKIPIDYIYNPFGVYGRMNIGQILEAVCSKSVFYTDNIIKNKENNKEGIINSLINLNENTIKYLNDSNYYESVKNHINELTTDSKKYKNFIKDVQKTNLYIEALDFPEIDIKQLVRNSIPTNEKILIKKQTIEYMKKRLKLNIPFDSEDTVIDNIFCAPIYITKLYKIAKEMLNSRDFGGIKSISGQPLKGRAKGGGSQIGQMEMEGIIGHGCWQVLKEFQTVKSDWNQGKHKFLNDIIYTGNYDLPDEHNICGQTKKVIDTLIKAYND